MAKNFQTTDRWHHYIQQYDIGAPDIEKRNGFTAIVSLKDLVALSDKQVMEKLLYHGGIIRYKYLSHPVMPPSASQKYIQNKPFSQTNWPANTVCMGLKAA
jgi:hypothetical protein